MSDLFDRVTGDQDIFKKLLSKIPGFDGYIEKHNRRMSDKMLREKVAAEYELLWGRLSALQRDLIDNGDLMLVDDLESAAIKLRQFIDRVKTASYGYTGFFDSVKLKTEDLARVYEYDLELFNLADSVSAAIDNVEASIGTDGLPAALRNVKKVTRDCVEAFEKRSEVMISSEQQAG
ncbi:MAG: hypothetical protein D9V45_10795 [Chloroflexi bacterium]|jgi:hypothetical protein|nr:hypothetical protein [Anaerolinea sp.]TDA65081.1 MAG: hypothetical protein D9V45_10795 [Chloroflexota bacterium]